MLISQIYHSTGTNREVTKENGKLKVKDGFQRFHALQMCVYVSVFLHLASSVEFVGQFDFVEGHRSFHPVGTEVGGVGVDVDTAVTVRLRFARRDPLAVHVLPAVPVCGAEVQQERIHGVGIQTRHADLQNWKHPPAKEEL